jgi:hypothetical protein
MQGDIFFVVNFPKLIGFLSKKDITITSCTVPQNRSNLQENKEGTPLVEDGESDEIFILKK